LIARFRHGAEKRGLSLLPSRSPIQPVRIGASDAALRVSARLETAGYFVPAIRPPTVSADTARLRVTLSAAHEAFQVDSLLDALVVAGAPQA
jgi:8-amino-7-oxononanoate synthase